MVVPVVLATVVSVVPATGGAVTVGVAVAAFALAAGTNPTAGRLLGRSVSSLPPAEVHILA